MNSRFLLLLITYLLWIVVFMVQKVLFVLYHHATFSDVGMRELFHIIYVGLPLDLSTAAFLIIIPALLYSLSLFFVRSLKQILQYYILFAVFLVSIVFVADTELYSYWGFKIDSTIFTYLVSPVEAMASLSFGAILLSFLLILLFTAILFILFKKVIINRFPTRPVQNKIVQALLFIPVFGLIFIAMRGGLGVSTINVSRSYFSNSTFRNHAAINPLFNLFFSINFNEDFSEKYRFMDDDDATVIFQKMMEHDKDQDVASLLHQEKPNLIIILLESFGAQVVEPLGGEKGVTPCLNRYMNEGVFFTHLYASSFRTDRGIVSALAGYPAQPTMTILKYPKKTQALPSVPKALANGGYHNSLLYGGDVNFANLNTFFVTQQVTDIFDEADFQRKQTASKWGAPDAVTFEKLFEELNHEKTPPFCKIFLTLSSHEPFDIPTNRFEEPYLNSVFYTDSCLGVFIEKVKNTEMWKNTLIVLIPDHNMRYPKTMESHSPQRHQSFMLWLGGAIKENKKIDRICSQIDLARTLLCQLHIPHDDFIFSRNILDTTLKQFAFYTFPNGFGAIDNQGTVVYSCEHDNVLLEEGEKTDSLLLQGKAFLQKLYDDIERLGDR